MIRDHKLVRVCGEPLTSGRIKTRTEDFVVEEVLGFEPSGVGEHIMLQIRKQGLNSMDAVDRIARLSQVPKSDIGLCGLKDRHAITTQWISVLLHPGKQPVWAGLGENLLVLQVHRHDKKLRRGIHLGNRFKIRIRDLHRDIRGLQSRLNAIRIQGVPNYFGVQRFGYQNLAKAERLFAGKLRRISRSERSILLSAVRSQIFNLVLNERVRDGSWNQLGAGDVANLNQSNSYFVVESLDRELQSRLERFDIHPTGPLYGAGENPASGDTLKMENGVFAEYSSWCEGLVNQAVRFQRRALRIALTDYSWSLDKENNLDLEFFLPRGSYATTVLSELVATA